jgi:tRNA (guanine37-N1)-methyltransferase
MQFDILTIFPNSFDSYFNESIIKRAKESGKIKINLINIRDFAADKHKTTDDTPYGGGPGMVMKVEPIYKALQSIKKQKKCRVILFSAKGKIYKQKDAKRLAKYDQLVFICGHYEGVDERVKKFVDEEISIGEYVLTGGEIPAMILVDSVSRMVPGVLGNVESAKTESFSKEDILEYPQYTKPSVFETKESKKLRVPKVLLSGNHKEIEKWRVSKGKITNTQHQTSKE